VRIKKYVIWSDILVVVKLVIQWDNNMHSKHRKTDVRRCIMTSGGNMANQPDIEAAKTVKGTIIGAIRGIGEVTTVTVGVLSDTIRSVIKGVGEVGGEITASARYIAEGAVEASSSVGIKFEDAAFGIGKGAVKGTADIGGDLALASRNAVEGVIDSAKRIGVKAEDAASAAASGAIEGAGEISESAVKAVTEAVSGTISGVKVVVKTPFKKDQ
jgi:hypothetical protein